MSFDRSQVLLGFLLYIPLIILEVRHYRRRGPALERVLGTCTDGQTPLPDKIRQFQRYSLTVSLLRGLFFGLLIIALAGPRWGQQLEMEYRRGVDVVFALDLSRSMEVTDASDGRSRLETGLSIAQDVARGAGDLRLGAAIGKGRGVLAVPLTYDTRTIEQFLESLSVSAITGWGTNLETLIDASAGAFQDGFPTSREIILFSDGEALSGTFGAAIDRLVSRGIRLSVVGLGTEQGGVVPGSPSVAEAPVSFRRGEPLRNAAERTGGLYLDGNDPDTGSRLMASLRALGRTSGIQGYRQEAKARWRLFVLAALMLWGIARSLGLERRGHG